MNSSSQVLSAFAQDRISKIVSLIIRQLQGSKITLSGEDSGLENTWDEICVQIQHEYAYQWDLYEETVLETIKVEVDSMAWHEQLAIWLETEAAYSYDDDEDDLESMYDPSDTYYHIKSIIFQKADHWSNKRIRKYLENS